MKKKLLAILLSLTFVFAFTACGDSSESTSDTAGSDEAATEETTVEETVYGVGDTWTVDGQWNFTIDSVEATDQRNEFEESNPEQVIYIKYHYENLGYEDEDGIMDGLYISPEQVIDSDGNVCTEYPINPEDIYPQETPVGAKCTAGIAFGLAKAGSPVTMNLSVYDGHGTEQTAKFNLEF